MLSMDSGWRHFKQFCETDNNITNMHIPIIKANMMCDALIGDAEYIFVDYFDTVCYRHIHSWQVLPQWAKAIINRWPKVTEVADKDSIVRCREQEYSRYQDIKSSYIAVYQLLNGGGQRTAQLTEFLNFCEEIDIAIEVGCQYPNTAMLKFLQKQKKKGKHLILVTDFYLPNSTYEVFFEQLGYADLFERMFVSNDIGKTKNRGDIYPFVLDELGIKAKQTVMIGDSRHSDVKMAKKYGIKPIWYFPIFHKLKTNYSLRTHKHYNIVNHKAKQQQRNTIFGEYAFTLYYFTKQLAEALAARSVDNANFLSRGGYFIKKCYDAYINVAVPECDKYAKSNYVYISRHTVIDARDAKEEAGNAYTLLKEYLNDFRDGDGSLTMIDEGWYNHSQQRITEMFCWKTNGLYIGSCRKEVIPHNDICHRQGLLFDMDATNKPSEYYGIFCANRSLYEQLLTAPAGSVTAYTRNQEGKIEPVENWDEREKTLYEQYLNDIQKHLLWNFKAIVVWNIGEDFVTKKSLSSVMLDSALINSKKRCEMLQIFDSKRVDNVSNGKRTADKNVKDLHVNITELLMHPEMYVGAMAKVQRRIYTNKVANSLYLLFIPLVKSYIKISWIWNR